MEEKTLFTDIYDRFLTSVTSDLYMELTESDTYNMLQDLLLKAIHQFEFPRFNINDYVLGELDEDQEYKGVDSNDQTVLAAKWEGGYFNAKLTEEEQEIIADYMIVEWLTQQLTTTENTRQKFSGSDFKFTSQAAHMEKLKNILKEYKDRAFHLQRLYCRRMKDKNGRYRPTMGLIMTPSSYYDIKKIEEEANRDNKIQ